MFLFTQFLTSVQAQKAAAETAAPALAGAFVDLRSRIESSLGELEQHAGAMSDAEYQTWQERVSAFQKEIGEASKSAAIDAEHQEQLKVAVRNLRMELQLLKPERVVAAESPASAAKPGRAGRTPPS
jgi:urate oxidase